jgi:CheY-like chemotaxis protein
LASSDPAVTLAFVEGLLLAGIHVLVIDDDADIRELYEAVLTRAGAEVCTVADGTHALRTAAAWPPDVILSDLRLREDDGLCVLQELRSMERLEAVPAIAVSGSTSEKDQLAARAAGFQQHVAKPVDPDELVEIVGHWAHQAK